MSDEPQTDQLYQRLSELERLHLDGDVDVIDDFRKLSNSIDAVLKMERDDDRFGEVVVALRGLMRLNGEAIAHHEWVVEALARETSDPTRVLLEIFHAQFVGDQVDRAEAISSLKKLEPRTISLNARDRTVHFDNLLGTFLCHDTEFEEGQRRLNESCDEALRRGDTAAAVYQYVALVRTNLREGRHEEALKAAERGYALAKRGKLSRYTGATAGWLGAILTDDRDYPRAIGLLEEAVESCQNVPIMLATNAGNLGIARLANDEIESAKTAFEIAHDAMRKFDVPIDNPLLISYIALCDFALTHFDDARAGVNRALNVNSANHPSSADLIVFLLKFVVSSKFGEPTDPWREKITQRQESFSQAKISADCFDAILNNTRYEAQSGVERAFLSTPQSITLRRNERIAEISRQRVDFKRRQPAWNVLLTLGEAPDDQAVAAWDLVEAAWPEEALGEEHLTRLYVTIKRLRESGFQIETSADGYVLRNAIVV